MPGMRAPEAERKEQILEAALRVALRDRLDGFSTRKVASEAGLSHGLVFFHFNTRDELIIALLEKLMQQLAVPQVDETLSAIVSPLERLIELLRRELTRLCADRERVELFFDFWVEGTRNLEIRRRIRGILETYRKAVYPITEEILRTAPLAGVTPEGLTIVAVGIMEGCLMQVVVDPENFDLNEYQNSARALLMQLVSQPEGAHLA